MTYAVSRDGQSLGTYSEEGLARRLTHGDLLPTDLVFLDREQKWLPISELSKAEVTETAQFAQKLELATPRAYVTPALLALNVFMFLVMIAAGVSLIDPKPGDLLRLGADFGPYTTNGQWWRLLTAAFLHAGILHIAMNLWALSSGGTFTERLFGNSGFLTLYLLSAIGGNLASLWWNPLIVSVGASGAIFGVYGGLIGLLLLRHRSIPETMAGSLTSNALLFVGYNIVFGLRDNSHIDIAAHLGGLATGLVVGAALAYRVDPVAGGPRWKRSAAVACAALLIFFPIARKLYSGDQQQAENYMAEFAGKRVAVGKHDVLIYSGTATDDEAQQLSKWLKGAGFFKDRGSLVLYSRDSKGAVVSFLVKETGWKDPRVSEQFHLLGFMMSRTVKPPLKVRLLDMNRAVKKEFSIG